MVGEDPDLDARRFRRAGSGICLITQPMVDRLDSQSRAYSHSIDWAQTLSSVGVRLICRLTVRSSWLALAGVAIDAT